MRLASVFIILSYFALRFYRRNYFYNSQSLCEESVLATVCGKVVETVIQTCQPSIRELPRTETINLQVAVFEY